MRINMYQSGDAPCVKDCDGMEYMAFRNFCAEILRRNGFSDVLVPGGKNGDEGIDIYASKDGKSYGIQCKKYKEKEIDMDTVEFVNELAKKKGKTAGMIMTTKMFTKTATTKGAAEKMLLWNRIKLQEMVEKTFPEYDLEYYAAQKASGKKFEFGKDGKIIFMYCLIFLIFMAVRRFT